MLLSHEAVKPNYRVFWWSFPWPREVIYARIMIASSLEIINVS